MGCWNPALVIGLGTGSHSRSVSAHDRNLLRRIDRLATAGRSLSTLATLAAALLLGEKLCDPHVVDEVASAAKNTGEEEVEEDAVNRC